VSKQPEKAAPLLLSIRRSSHVQIYSSLYYESKIAPLFEKQAAIDKDSFAAAGKKWSKLITRNKIATELYANETPDVIATVEAERERLYQKELDAQNSMSAKQRSK
jgi:hypothetical protein